MATEERPTEDSPAPRPLKRMLRDVLVVLVIAIVGLAAVAYFFGSGDKLPFEYEAAD